MAYTVTLGGVTAGHDPPIVLQAITGIGQSARKVRVAVPAGGHVPSGRDVHDSRDITCDFAITDLDADVALDYHDDLVAAWAATDETVELEVTVTSGWTRSRRGRPVSIDTDLALVSRGVITARGVFDAFDPIWYGTAHSVTVAVGGTGGGMVTPMVTPMVTVAGTGPPGDAVVTNDGTASTDWTASLTGGTLGVETPRLILDGHVVEVNGTIPAGSVLYIDSRERSVLLDGNPRPWVTYASTWWQIPPGQSTLNYRAVSGDGTAALMWRDAYH